MLDVVIILCSQIDRLSGTVCVHDPLKTPNAAGLDSMTLQSYIEQHAWTAGQFKFVCIFCFLYVLLVRPTSGNSAQSSTHLGSLSFRQTGKNVQ